MASLDDIPTLPPTTPTSDDLIAIIDGADRRSPKRVSLAQVGSLVNGISPSEVTIVTDQHATISTRMTVRASNAMGTLTLPSPSGDLRELFIVVTGESSATLNGLLDGDTYLPDTTGSAHLLSTGVRWYRVS